MAQYKDVTGQIFGRLTVVSFSHRDKYKQALWTCNCICGKICVVKLQSLSTGATRSCGCLNEEVRKKRMLGNTYAKTYGLSKHYLYQTWVTMKQRCYNENHNKYYLYGARGIRVCKEWLASFEAFLFDMGDRPKGCTLNRKDNNGNYCKENCEWATFSDQNSNRRKYKINKRRKDVEIKIDGYSHY